MQDSMQLLILSLGFGLVLSATVFFLMKAQVNSLTVTLDNSNLHLRETQIQLNKVRQENQDLVREMMNRSQSEDLKTFLSLQSNQNLLERPEAEYIPRTDEAEIQIISQAQGLGTVNYDDDTAGELGAVFGEFGVEFPEEIPRREGT